MLLQSKSALHTHTHIFDMAEFCSFNAIPGSPWAVIRHREEKGHTQAFTIHNRTDKKYPENKLQSGKGTKENSLT